MNHLGWRAVDEPLTVKLFEHGLSLGGQQGARRGSSPRPLARPVTSSTVHGGAGHLQRTAQPRQRDRQRRRRQRRHDALWSSSGSERPIISATFFWKSKMNFAWASSGSSLAMRRSRLRISSFVAAAPATGLRPQAYGHRLTATGLRPRFRQANPASPCAGRGLSANRSTGNATGLTAQHCADSLAVGLELVGCGQDASLEVSRKAAPLRLGGNPWVGILGFFACRAVPANRAPGV